MTEELTRSPDDTAATRHEQAAALFPAPGILSATIKPRDFMCKEGVIDLRLKVLP